MLFKIVLFVLFVIFIYSLIILLGCFDFKTKNADIVIVLGHKLKDNLPTIVLKYRLQKTINYYDLYNPSMIILSGGITNGNSKTEASIMKEYLLKNGIDDKCIVLEDSSTDTIENIRNCKKYIDCNKKIVLITSNYHMLRAKMICKLNGLKVKGVSCKTPIIELIKHLTIEEIFIPIHYFRLRKKDID